MRVLDGETMADVLKEISEGVGKIGRGDQEAQTTLYKSYKDVLYNTGNLAIAL